ncbi:MAG: ATP-binding cassette domain-containing protein [Candidatus Bathyarchaeota archaeon]
MPIIEIRDLSYSYPNIESLTLADINLTVEEGEFVVFTGPSGCGKTTLCRCLNGLIPHFYGGDLKGDVKVVGLSISDHSISDMAQHVGFVFQSPENQLFALSVEKDVAFGLENLALPREEIRKSVEWAMDIVGISDLREKAPFELSGGQQQRVAIASVLTMKPKLVVLDEPTSFLDPLASKNLFEIIKKLNRELGLTMILIEHRLDLLSTYASRIIVMDKGRIKADGSPRSVLSSTEVESLGIGLPKIFKLHRMLKENGVDLGEPPLSVEEFVKSVRKALKHD